MTCEVNIFNDNINIGYYIACLIRKTKAKPIKGFLW